MTVLSIEAMGQLGDGLARTEGRTIAVPYALPGERVETQPDGDLRISVTSPERQEAFCPAFGRCGGCKLQHWKQHPYAVWKRGLLSQALAAKALAPDIDPLVDAHGDGRRRVSLHVREQGGQWVAGFMEARSHSLCAIATCPVLAPRLQHAPQVAASFGAVLGTCDVAATLSDTGLDISVKAERKAVPRRLESLQAIFDCWALARLSINGEVLLSNVAPQVLMGQAQVKLPVNSFLQATAAGETAIAGLVREGLPKCKTIADLFCGVGPFALRLAEVAKVQALDSDKLAIAALQEALRFARGLKPVVAAARDLFKAPMIATELAEFDGVVLDPPRAGAEAQSRQLARSNVKRVVYVSCDVQSFARDAAILCEGGYTLRRVTPVDQFKWTAHLETVGCFVKT